MKVRAITPDGDINIGTLAELSANPDLKDYQIVCHWKDGSISSGWSSGQHVNQLISGYTFLRVSTENVIFGRIQP